LKRSGRRFVLASTLLADLAWCGPLDLRGRVLAHDGVVVDCGRQSIWPTSHNKFDNECFDLLSRHSQAVFFWKKWHDEKGGWWRGVLAPAAPESLFYADYLPLAVGEYNRRESSEPAIPILDDGRDVDPATGFSSLDFSFDKRTGNVQVCKLGVRTCAEMDARDFCRAVELTIDATRCQEMRRKMGSAYRPLEGDDYAWYASGYLRDLQDRYNAAIVSSGSGESGRTLLARRREAVLSAREERERIQRERDARDAQARREREAGERQARDDQLMGELASGLSMLAADAAVTVARAKQVERLEDASRDARVAGDLDRARALRDQATKLESTRFEATPTVGNRPPSVATGGRGSGDCEDLAARGRRWGEAASQKAGEFVQENSQCASLEFGKARAKVNLDAYARCPSLCKEGGLCGQDANFEFYDASARKMRCDDRFYEAYMALW